MGKFGAVVTILATSAALWCLIFRPMQIVHANFGLDAQDETKEPIGTAQPSPSETRGTCSIATQPANPPKGAIAISDYDSAPMEFLFSDQGADVYSATSYRRPYPLQWISDHGLTAIIIYQDEGTRQKQIEHLRKSKSLPFRLGFPQHLENVKYAMVNFFGPGGSFVRALEYFEPKPCVTIEDEELAGQLWMHYPEFEVWAMPGLHASKSGPNWVTGLESHYLIVAAEQSPIYVKIHNTMAARVRAYMLKNPDR